MGQNSRNNETIIQPTLSTCMLDKYSKQNYIEKHTYLTANELWQKIEYDINVSPKIKRTIKLKFTYDFKKKRSNKEVAEIVGCSEETVRKQINQFKNQYNSK